MQNFGFFGIFNGKDPAVDKWTNGYMEGRAGRHTGCQRTSQAGRQDSDRLTDRRQAGRDGHTSMQAGRQTD
jgi:hypothetical protein